MKKHLFYGAVFLLIFATQIFAQVSNQTTTTNNQTTTKTAEPADENNSDLVITANVRAKELKFEVVPTPTVTFPGTPNRQNVWEADRTNLPEQVQPGVVYRDIGIRLRIYSRFAEIQRIVLEALDEPEAAAQTTPANNAPNNQNTTTTTTAKKP